MCEVGRKDAYVIRLGRRMREKVREGGREGEEMEGVKTHK